MTFGIIGLGKIGRTIVQKAKGFQMKVAAYDPYVDDDIFRLKDIERKYELEDLLRESNYVTIHAPLTPETYHMINERAFELINVLNGRRPRYIVNPEIFGMRNLSN
jgi:D-3-phosphoglycerate dehydrogenase